MMKNHNRIGILVNIPGIYTEYVTRRSYFRGIIKPQYLSNESYFDKGEVPALEYEKLRRRIHTNTEEFWNYVKHALSRHLDDGLKNNKVRSIEVVLKETVERKRSLISDLEKLPAVDGYNEWRRHESAEVSDLIQQRLHYIQNPADCNASEKLQCDVHGCGFGCQLSLVMGCMVLGYATERTVVLNRVSPGWQYYGRKWENVLHSLTPCKISSFDDKVLPWDTQGKIVGMPDRDIVFPLAVPTDLAKRTLRFNGEPSSWWMGQVLKYVFRMHNETQKEVDIMTSKIDFTHPFVGVHVRRTDKVTSTEADYHHFYEYMDQVEDYFETLELTQNITERRVYLASDDPSIFKEARTKYPQYKFLGNETVAKTAGGIRFTPHALTELMADMQVLSRSSHLVCTISSTFSRTAYLMMQANRLDASVDISSLDDFYLFLSTHYGFPRIAVKAHIPLPNATHEMALQLGDLVKMRVTLVPGKFRVKNGMVKGINLRTNQSGLFPWYKTSDRLELFPFPEYSHVCCALKYETDCNKVALELQKSFSNLAKLRQKYQETKLNLEGSCFQYNNISNIHEKVVRKIYSNIEELWLFLKNEIKTITGEHNDKKLKRMKAVVTQIEERIRSLMSDFKKIQDNDGYIDWRKNEAAKVSELIQQRLMHLQNPPDCRKAKKILCEIPNECGFGCQLHHIVYCLIHAYATRRTLIVNSTNWRYNKRGWEDIFQPLSDTCVSIYGDNPVAWPADDAKVVFVQTQYKNYDQKPKFLPFAIPEDLSHRIVLFNGDPVSWWISQLLKFVLRMNYRTQKEIHLYINNINFTNPIVGIQVRRTDKLTYKEASFHSLHEYISHVKDFYDTLELTQPVDVRSVYIASDSAGIFSKAREDFPQYKFLVNPTIAAQGPGKSRYSRQGLIGVMVDLQLLERSDHIVCTFTSNMCRIAYEMMQANRLDAPDSVTSLDVMYYFRIASMMNPPVRIATMSHFPLPGVKREISFVKGDLIELHAPGNHLNGYGRGTNRRTNKTGVFPWFKTAEHNLLYKFPTTSSSAMVNRFEIRRTTTTIAYVFACVPLIMTLCLVSTTFRRYYETCNSDVLLGYQERLSSVSAQLAALGRQHRNLVARAKKGKINTKDLDKSSAMLDKGPGPPLMYEIQRRAIHTNTKELWNYLRFTFDRLVKDIKKANNAKRIQIILDQISERKRSLLSDLQSLPKVDGYNKWRENEANEVSDLIQRRLHHLQNPVDCQSAKKVVCEVLNVCGFGCQMHHVVYCLVFAYATQRTLILQSKLWQYEQKGWSHVFEPISDTCTITYDERVMPWYVDEARVVLLPELELIEKQQRPKFLPPAIPKDLAERIEKFNGDPSSWWIGQLVKFLLRPKANFKEAVANITKKINLTAPVVGLQIRRSDKIKEKESELYDLQEYMVHVKDYYDQLELTQNVAVRRVYLASDDPTAITDAREKYPLYEFLGDQSIAKVAAGKKRFTTEGLVGLLVDLKLLAQCDLLVCTFSSNFCRLAYAMMQSNRIDASKSAVSLDDIFHFWGSDKPSRITVIPHFPSSDNPDEIIIMPGDVINVTSNLWNGYGRGSNIRTNSSGIFPWYKTNDHLVLYPFPEYKAVDVP